MTTQLRGQKGRQELVKLLKRLLARLGEKRFDALEKFARKDLASYHAAGEKLKQARSPWADAW